MDTTTAVEGKQSAVLRSTGRGENLVAWQEMSAEGGMTYLLKAWVRVPEGGSATMTAASLAGARVLQRHTSTESAAGAAWSQLELRFVTPPETERVRVMLRTTDQAAFDDVRLTVEGTWEPTNAAEAKNSAQTDSTVASPFGRKYEALRSKMSLGELAWERLLEAEAGNYYFPRHRADQLSGKRSRLGYPGADDPSLPRVLIIGDSISLGYTLPLRDALEGIANVHRAPSNCGPKQKGLEKLPIWLMNVEWDLITFNFGIHDRETSDQVYAQRLEAIIQRLQATDADLLWINSTALSEGSMGGKRGQMHDKNAVARDVIGKYGIPMVDLHSISINVIEHQYGDGCHFKDEANNAFGAHIAHRIKLMLQK